MRWPVRERARANRHRLIPQCQGALPIPEIEYGWHGCGLQVHFMGVREARMDERRFYYALQVAVDKFRYQNL